MKNKYVCIGTHGTSQAKFWNYPNGWQILVDYLVDRGYDVYAISKEYTELNNVIDKTGDEKIEDRINDLKDCEFFIGLSSGLSWLAWASGAYVFLISGHTQPWYEFESNCTRIFNDSVCNGCWHNHDFDKGDWNWCPEHKGTDRMFECTKSITPQTIINKIEKYLRSKNV